MAVCKLAFFCGASVLFYQSAPVVQSKTPASGAYTPHLVFDTASIRESRDGNMSFIDNVPKTSIFRGVRLSPWGLILTAYDLKIGKLLENAPSWAETTRWDVMAKSDASTDEALAKLSDADFYAEKRHMLQVLLAERFHLDMDAETRISTMYELVATARTTKLMTPISGSVAKIVSTCAQKFSRRGREIDTSGCPFSILLSQVRQEVGTNVVDSTGMSGAYAYHLMWGSSQATLQEDEDRYPDIKVALREQLGLELKPPRGR